MIRELIMMVITGCILGLGISATLNMERSAAAPVYKQTTDTRAYGTLSGLKLYDNLPSLQSKKALANPALSVADSARIARLAAPAQPFWLATPQAALPVDFLAIITAAKQTGRVPLVVIYGVPWRDCGRYSAGGASQAQQYSDWISRIAAALDSTSAIVILEPDALAGGECLPKDAMTARKELIAQAVKTLKINPTTYVYIDAGNPGWMHHADMAQRLSEAGISRADGFAVNVSNYYTTAESVAYGQDISGLVGGKGFVVDTSRNGRGPAGPGQWCNPPGRAIGDLPRILPGPGGVDAYLWIKNPGESDGTCNGGPVAGQLWLPQALELARNAE